MNVYRLRLPRIILCLTLILAGCASPSATPTVAPPTETAAATATDMPTIPPTATLTATATKTPTTPPTAMLTATATKTPTLAPTKTATATPRPTRVPVTVTPAPTDTPSGPTPIPDTGWTSAVGGGAHGVTGSFQLEALRTWFRPGEPIWFMFDLTNATSGNVPYGLLGVVGNDLDPADGSGGRFHTSWDGRLAADGSGKLAFNPGPFHHRDYLTLDVPGHYSLYVSMCFSPFKDCLNGGDWENVSGPINISIVNQ